MKERGHPIKRHADFRVGLLFVFVHYSSLLQIDNHCRFNTRGEGQRSERNQLSPSIFNVYIRVFRVNVFSSNRLIHMYVQKIKI